MHVPSDESADNLWQEHKQGNLDPCNAYDDEVKSWYGGNEDMDIEILCSL